MTIVLIILTALLGVAFYFINALINRWHDERERIQKLEEKFEQLSWEIDDIFERHNSLRDFTDEVNAHVEQDKTNINACANAILNMRNDIGKLGNRLQKVEKEGKED